MTSLLRNLLRKIGYRIISVPAEAVGGEPLSDMAAIVGKRDPMILDIGANSGQTIDRFHRVFKSPTIHSFEPSPGIFQRLNQHAGALVGVHLWNNAMGATADRLLLQENEGSEYSSILPLGRDGLGQVTNETLVSVDTVDAFCERHEISGIDILKSDTQGYELEVLRGAERMMTSGAILLIYCEMTFAEQYECMPSAGQLYDYLTDHGFRLVSLYGTTYRSGLAHCADGLFIYDSVAPLAKRAVPGYRTTEQLAAIVSSDAGKGETHPS